MDIFKDIGTEGLSLFAKGRDNYRFVIRNSRLIAFPFELSFVRYIQNLIVQG